MQPPEVWAGEETEPAMWWETPGDGNVDPLLKDRLTEAEGWMYSFYYADSPAFLYEYRGTPVVKGQTFKIPSAISYYQTVRVSGSLYQKPVLGEADRLNLTSLEFPNNGRFTLIGNDAFRDCKNLTEVAFPDTLTTICPRAFQGCESLSKLVIPPSVILMGKDAFKDTAANFTIYGAPGSVAHLYATCYKIPFVSTTTDHLTLEAPEETNQKIIEISGYTNASQVQIYVNDTLLNPAVAVDDNFMYTIMVEFPENGDYEIRAVADIDGKEVSAARTVHYDKSMPDLLGFTAYSAAHNSTGPVNLLQPGLAKPILWHQNGRIHTFEIKLSEPPEVTRVSVVSERNGEEKSMEANWDPSRKVWVASGFFDPADVSYVPGELSVWCEWNGKEISGGTSDSIGTPDKDSELLQGVGARAYVPEDNSANGTYKKINPNSGRNNLAPGLSVITNKGSKQWILVVEQEAVGTNFVFWAHAGGDTNGEYIFVTFDKAGRYKIGSDNGMNHMALVQHGTTSMGSGIVGSGKCRVIIDPSGYVYEAVPGNRLGDVRTTIYYMGDDAGNPIDRYEAEPQGKPILWNAEEYEQKNPLYTDANGGYAWDVPDGWWQVKYEREGYETKYSEWMPVPPEQTEVNVGLVSKTAPAVEQVNGYPEGMEITFSKYMKLGTLLQDYFTVTKNGVAVHGKIEFVNAEYNYDGSARYASVVRFVPEQELSGNVQLTVSGAVESYADVAMAEAYTKNVVIRPEPKSIIAQNRHLSYGESGDVTVRLEPAEAVSGMTLKAVSDNPYVASVAEEEVVLNEQGEAVVHVTGKLPGTAQITLTLADTRLQTQIEATVGLPNQFDYEVESVCVLSEGKEPAISTLNGTLKMTAAVMPVNAANRAVTWSVENGTGEAVIDGTGLLTAVRDGTVTVKATANDGSGEYGTLQVNITGQRQPAGMDGPTKLTVTEGYSGISTDAFQISGDGPVVVKKASGDSKITWNDSTKKLDIAAGLPAGIYPVTLEADNGAMPAASFSFTLTVIKAPTITGEERMTLTEGYDAVSTKVYAITGTEPVQVKKTSGDAKITWDNNKKCFQIAPGLKKGSYPVTLEVSSTPDVTVKFTFVLEVKAAETDSDAIRPAPVITEVRITPVAAKVEKGKTRQFTAVVKGNHSPSQRVIWKVTGNKKKGTKISSTGKLKIAVNETAKKLTVTAVSVSDRTRLAKATVRVVTPRTAAPSKKAIPASRKVKRGTKITIRAPKDTVLYYTTNRRTPTKKSKKVRPAKAVKIKISKNTTIKVFALKKNCQASRIVTRTYKIK